MIVRALPPNANISLRCKDKKAAEEDEEEERECQKNEWFRWDHLSRGWVRAATYLVLNCVKSGWGSRAASGQTEQEARTITKADRRSVQTRCFCVHCLSDHNIYSLPLTFGAIYTSGFISFSSPPLLLLLVISLIDFLVKCPTHSLSGVSFVFEFIPTLLS